jgi:hypothetical protein
LLLSAWTLPPALFPGEVGAGWRNAVVNGPAAARFNALLPGGVALLVLLVVVLSRGFFWRALACFASGVLLLWLPWMAPGGDGARSVFPGPLRFLDGWIGDVSVPGSDALAVWRAAPWLAGLLLPGLLLCVAGADALRRRPSARGGRIALRIGGVLLLGGLLVPVGSIPLPGFVAKRWFKEVVLGREWLAPTGAMAGLALLAVLGVLAVLGRLGGSELRRPLSLAYALPVLGLVAVVAPLVWASFPYVIFPEGGRELWFWAFCGAPIAAGTLVVVGLAALLAMGKGAGPSTRP